MQLLFFRLLILLVCVVTATGAGDAPLRRRLPPGHLARRCQLAAISASARRLQLTGRCVGVELQEEAAEEVRWATRCFRQPLWASATWQ